MLSLLYSTFPLSVLTVLIFYSCFLTFLCCTLTFLQCAECSPSMPAHPVFVNVAPLTFEEVAYFQRNTFFVNNYFGFDVSMIILRLWTTFYYLLICSCPCLHRLKLLLRITSEECMCSPSIERHAHPTPLPAPAPPPPPPASPPTHPNPSPMPAWNSPKQNDPYVSKHPWFFQPLFYFLNFFFDPYFYDPWTKWP
jgi:hypothetical protein